MGIRNVLTKKFVRNKIVFADIFNYFLFGGQQVIAPDSLRVDDVASLATPFKGQAKKAEERTRDNIYTVMRDDKYAYLLLGIENQSNIHYAMPVRNMLYDVLSYVEQIEQNGSGRKGSYLSQWRKKDRLNPVITLVINWSKTKWSAAKSIHEMLADEDPTILRFVPDYKINLIEPFHMTDVEIEKFQSDFGTLCMYMSNASDKKKLEQITNDPKYRILRRDTAMLLNEFIELELPEQEEEEDVDMCLAIKQIREESYLAGQMEERKNFKSALTQIREESYLAGQMEERKNLKSALNQIREESVAHGRSEGIAILMMEDNHPLQKIIDRTNFDKDTLMQLAEENNIAYNFV